MSFLKRPDTVLTDLTDSKKLQQNLRRIEADEMAIIKRIEKYDKKIAEIEKKVKKKGKEIRVIVSKIKKLPKTKKESFIKKKNNIVKEQSKLVFKEKAQASVKQSELLKYYQDLIESIKILRKMKKLKLKRNETY